MDALGDLYALLGVPPTAPQDEILKAYRAAAGRFHPDVNAAPAASLVFREITTAYEILSDPNQRGDYDRSLAGRDDDHTHLNLSVQLSRHVLPRLDEPQLVYAMLTLEPPPGGPVTASGSPLNLALVLDRSTSMQGPRLDQVKAATGHIIEQLEDEDIVTVVAFSDRAEVYVPASRPTDRRTMRATVSTIRAGGATAIYEGLLGGMREMSKMLHPRYVNHLLLVTDGHTYGDEDACLALADQAYEQGISISAMGIGEDWNDEFLDKLASRTGGTSDYISSPTALNAFVEQRIRSLGAAYAERTRLVVATSPQAQLDALFKVSPDAMPLGTDPQPIALGVLDAGLPTSLVLQFSVPSTMNIGDDGLSLGRISLHADILRQQRAEQALADLSVEVRDGVPAVLPPPALFEAINRMTLYNIQESARVALEGGKAEEATRALEYLATRLFEQGEDELANAALAEAQRVAATQVISGVGRKNLKYGTRALMLPYEDG